MSVGIATMGMFNPCCGSNIAGGGGAPPYRRDEERIKPLVRVIKFKMKTIKISEQIFKNVSIKLLNEDE